MNKKPEALEAMERALRLLPKDGHYLEECGHLAYVNGKFQVAQHYFEEAEASPSSTWQTPLGLGACSYRQNLFDEAIAYWQKGTAAVPQPAGVLLQLGTGPLSKRRQSSSHPVF